MRNPRHALARAGATALGLACAGLLLAPARGFTFLGGALRLDQRDVRVFDNFTDPEARENTDMDPSFPGATGPVLALWKAVVEWGSRAHGDGRGDPTQPVIGSGGANFEFVWQGQATSVGGTNDNVISEISGGSLGVLAFTELPVADGWRIRFYAEPWVWDDGPGQLPPLIFRRDLQGVVAHELGHALGLGHSSVVGSTMEGSLTVSGVHLRSLEADDTAGLQALYGAQSAAKPLVTGYELGGPGLTLHGSGFAPAGNEVWFTRRALGADGTPVVAAGLASSDGGTRLALALPPEAAQGDVLVKLPGPQLDTLSNAFPFDPRQPPCPPEALFGTAKPTSLATVPALHLSGRPHLWTNDFRIGTAGGIAGASGFLLSSAGEAATPFAGGTLYLAPPLRREARFQFDFIGAIDIPVPVEPHLLGQTRYFQLWFVDAGDAFGTGLSNAAKVTFCPFL